MTITAKSITKLLTSSAKVANALDWKRASGSVLTLSVLKDRIDLALGSHPSTERSVQSLPSLPLLHEIRDSRKILSPKVVEELADLVTNFSVCGFVVSWPVQEEGWCGAPCGRVLHTLDLITAQSNRTRIFSPNRPVCLWDCEHHLPAEDEWGRAAVYAKTSSKREHIASEEQYKDHKCVASDVWDDFCKSHWPEIHQRRALREGDRKGVKEVDIGWLDALEDTSNYNKATAL